MTTLIKIALNKVFTDLVTNRSRLAEQQASLKQQMEVNVSQLAHFDVLLASLNIVLADEEHLESVADTIGDVALGLEVAPEPPQAVAQGTVDAPAPLTAAGSDAVAPAATPADVSAGTDGNGSPVPVDAVAAG